jgi:SPP1 family predicted phage head-tail adaptor
MVDYGKFKHRVTLQSVSHVVADGGRKTTTWPDIATVWARIDPAALGPQIRGDRLDFPVSHKVTVPYAAAYRATRRIIFGSRVFMVNSQVNPDEESRLLVFECEEGTN